MKWEALVVGMQGVIRDCGKYFTVTLTKAKVEAERMILLMTEKVDSGQLLSEAEYMQLCDAYRCLQLIENNAIQSSKVKSRCMEVNDLHANSKCFFDLLRAKRLRGTITMLETDGLTLRDSNSITAMCTQHYQNLFVFAYKTDDAWFSSLHDSLAFTPHALDSHMAVTCEKWIIEEEVFLAIRSLKNGKAPGMDGLTKEFVIAFWLSYKTLILDVCNEIWGDQKMPYSFKLGKIKLIPKLDVPKQMGDWRPITMMSIIYKIFPKIFALRLKPIIHRIVHPSQVGFIHHRSIFDNIFFAQILMEHATLSKQEIVALIDTSAQHFDSLKWVGPKFGKGTIFRHFGYPLGINVSTKDKIEWVLLRIRCKMDMWHATQWPLHIRIRIVQTFLQSQIFMWRIFASHFTLGAFLSKHGLQGTRPHCASYAENMRHAFWTCPEIQRCYTGSRTV
ncbi:hypothetical protein KP509_23G070800 [Ceratopteris richardii]|uniref:Reverse transcriptase domain-containing protein n=1 Tax=Ceratopteris richardii TaxID=49495 RepID=A0A8T2S3J6_CERRI|nr:hypothetical protein KP509_23G070800 [Ceratopteris richardii]